MLDVVGQIDVRHATFAQVAFDFVAVREGGREPGGDLGHGAKMARSGGGWRSFETDRRICPNGRISPGSS